ncbi:MULTISPECIES: hypothetical protein [Rhizobium]|uniref:Uncharacterized protein n=1 Tax=Rhizobium rhododendri TaxID=2506430 RepID=A0ABY8IH60_9HYPH|nr:MULTISPECIES: hypothetical protein [Rhizobium]MBZ5759780.1 hypothetical protein [Rhizobium sp. VS19-DR96]MBZ5766168.1 hypothetical protein [Rhizobium sp. VS19-DR129.2]MBZ5772951.1 hypothetical protein [Rhizobium sp. VS19-DRK62.2]MBZ5783935.1 hypothetical protein [Rhizobium sp. VS19-DR121]MBZ5803512.1 hypothetical protein [Rhizobium sp. VS19-DR181]
MNHAAIPKKYQSGHFWKYSEKRRSPMDVMPGAMESLMIRLLQPACPAFDVDGENS